ncbi:MAG: TlpA family protein disulfide reductase [Polyangiaceae bacterium]|jgi:cytochrome c biogenesis protein CcmG, thiol:disulfide interchange protein DsbE
MKLELCSVAALVVSSSVVLAGCGGAAPAGKGAAAANATAKKGEHPLVGSNVPSFAAPSANGKGRATVQPNDGKVLIVDFWATWCEPCKKSFPKLEDLYVRYKQSGMEIVAVSEDDENEGINGFGSSFGAKFPLVWDSGKAIASKWQPKSMPSTFIVDRKGVVRYVHLGYHDGEEAEIEKEVKSLL